MPEAPASSAGGARQTALGVAGAVLLVAVAVVALVVIGSRDEGSASGISPVVPPEVSVPEVTETPTPPPGVELDADEGIATIEREPTEADAAAFIASYDPPGAQGTEWISADLDQDGRSEVVVASIVGGRTRVDVAMWDGSVYAVRYTGQGGPAEGIETFAVRDVTGDRLAEILLEQRTTGRHSIALWGVTRDGIARQAAVGGCWDGSHVYGFDGVDLAPGTITATCDPGDSERPTATYVWDGDAWTHEPDGPPAGQQPRSGGGRG